MLVCIHAGYWLLCLYSCRLLVAMFVFMQGSRGSEQLQQLYAKTKKYREAVGKILSKIFSKEFPRGIDKISTMDLLKWDMWPTCISIYSKYAVTQSEYGSFIYIGCSSSVDSFHCFSFVLIMFTVTFSLY